MSAFKAKNPVVKVLPMTNFTKLVPSHFLDFYDSVIQRDTVLGEIKFDLNVKVSDLVDCNPEDGGRVAFKVFKFGLEHGRFSDTRLFDIQNANTPVYLTDLSIIAWFHNGPFALEVSSNKVIDAGRLNFQVHRAKINPEIEKHTYDNFPVLSCPPTLVTSSQPSNQIEDDLVQHCQEEELYPVDSTHVIFGGDDAINKFINTFSFVTAKSIASLSFTKNTSVFTPMISLLGLVCRMQGQTYPHTIPSPNFDENNSYLLEMDRVVATSCNKLIRENVEFLNKCSQVKFSDIEFGLKISNLAPRWVAVKDPEDGTLVLQDSSIDPGHARSMRFDETVTVKFRMFIGVLTLNPQGTNEYATDPLAKNIFFFKPWPVDALDGSGKPFTVLGPNKKELFDVLPGGKKVPVLRKPYQHINAIYEPTTDADKYIDSDPEYPDSLSSAKNKRTSKRTTSSPSSSSLMDDN